MNKPELIAKIEKLKPTAIKLGFDYPEGVLYEASTSELEEFLVELQEFIIENS